MSEQQRELYISKLLTGAIIGLLSWNIYTTHQMAIDVAVLKERVIFIEERVK